MMLDELSEDSRNFLNRIFQETNGDTSAQVSMYDIGSMLDLDRQGASRVAEDLISLDLVEIRTLSGAIGITDSAVKVLEQSTAEQASEAAAAEGLGEEAVLGPQGCTAVAQVTAQTKQAAGSLGLSFDALTEVMSDLKTIDAQMGSSRPKTAIVRECFRSLRNCLEEAGADDAANRIRMLLQE
jgi:hypothetical protein